MEQPEKAFEKPVFTMQLYGPAEVVEGMPAHFETRVVPIGDPNLKIQWFVNGVALKQGKLLEIKQYMCINYPFL